MVMVCVPTVTRFMHYENYTTSLLCVWLCVCVIYFIIYAFLFSFQLPAQIVPSSRLPVNPIPKTVGVFSAPLVVFFISVHLLIHIK